MDFRNALIPNNTVKLYCNTIDINAGYVMSFSDLGQSVSETDNNFLLKFELDRYLRSFDVLDEGRKFYPLYPGKYVCNINSDLSFILPTTTLLENLGVGIRIIHYNNAGIIIEESNSSYMTYIAGLNYYTARNTLTCNIIFDMKEGDYIGVLAFVAVAGSFNFNISFENTSLEINYINT